MKFSILNIVLVQTLSKGSFNHFCHNGWLTIFHNWWFIFTSFGSCFKSIGNTQIYTFLCPKSFSPSQNTPIHIQIAFIFLFLPRISLYLFFLHQEKHHCIFLELRDILFSFKKEKENLYSDRISSHMELFSWISITISIIHHRVFLKRIWKKRYKL